MTVGAASAEWIGRSVYGLASLVRGRRRQLPGPDSEPSRHPRIAILCDSFIRYGTQQAVGLRAAGADVTFYYVDRLGEFQGDAADRQRFLDLVHEAEIAVVPLPQRDMSRARSQVVDLHRDLKQRCIEALVVHQHIDPRYTTLGVRHPVALMLHDPRPHSGDYQSAYPPPVRAMARLSQLSSSCLLLHSRTLADQLHPLLRGMPLGFVPHGTEVVSVPPRAPVRPMILVAGRMMKYKGVDVALEAFRRVADKRKDCTMVVAGAGRLEHYAANHVSARVRFVDRYLPELELDQLLDAATVVVLPYLDATQSGVGLKAIGRGIPCIVSRVGALPDLVPSGSEWVVPPRDPLALSEAVLKVIDRGDEPRAELLRFASTRFAWPVVGRQLLAELRRLCVV